MKITACGLMAGVMMASSGFMTSFSYSSGDSISIVSAATTYEYFPKCSASCTSLVDALNSVGVNSSFSYRKNTIAPLNGYTSSTYTGTAVQNTNLLNLLKQGKLVKSKNTTPDTNTDKKTGTSSLIVNSSYNVSVSNKAKENKPHYENKEGSRSAASYNTVINQFSVASNSRYTRDSRGTYCNIFAWDVMSAMRAPLPHWIKNNAPATSSTKGAYEINANDTYNWLANYGSKYGWKKVSAAEAQARANKGYPTVAIWKNTGGKAGHVMVVRPEGNGYKYSSANGPVISQAGAKNTNYWNVKNAMGSNTPVYYTHN